MIDFKNFKASSGKSWKSTPKVLVLIILGIILIVAVSIFIWQLTKTQAPPPQPEVSLQTPPETTEETFRPGEIGEIPKGTTEKDILPLPPAVFNTVGVISEVGKDRLTVQGDGTNFSDKTPRKLTLIFTLSTIVFEPGQKTGHQGLDGLKYLKTGETISISSPENIRGKNQFIVDYINKL